MSYNSQNSGSDYNHITVPGKIVRRGPSGSRGNQQRSLSRGTSNQNSMTNLQSMSNFKNQRLEVVQSTEEDLNLSATQNSLFKGDNVGNIPTKDWDASADQPRRVSQMTNPGASMNFGNLMN